MQLGIIWTTFGVWIWIYFSNQLQLTYDKLNLGHTNTIHIMWQYKHVLVHLNSMLAPFVDDCAGNSASEMVITPEEEEHQ